MEIDSGRINQSAGSRRPLIGVITGSFHTDYSSQLTEAICRRLKAAGMDVCLFQGLDASRFLNIEGYVDKGFDRHYYSQFEYSRFIKPDILIVSFGTISAVRSPLENHELCRLFPDAPIIALETEEEIPNGVHILPDNYGGMCRCVEHLIKEHGCRDIRYISGPRGVADSELRLSAFRDTMSRHGLEPDEQAVSYGNFTDRVDQIAERILGNGSLPDAIVCANDEMAESVYRVLKAHGLTPGRDVAVTGFDDNPAAKLMDPPLTSVRQSKHDIADKLLEVVRSILSGEEPKSSILPAKLFVRESCGCVPSKNKHAEQSDRDEESRAMRDRNTIKRLSHETMLASLMLRNLLDQHITVHSFFRRLGGVLHRLGAEYSWIALLDEPMPVDGDNIARLPDRLRLHLVQDGSEVSFWSRREAPVISALDPSPAGSLIRPQGLSENDAVFPLFYDNMHYGVFVVRLSLENMLLFYTISLQIGTGLRYLFMALDDQEARAALEVRNQILDFSASHDTLTGLYNRAGVAKHFYEYISENGQEISYIAIAADLDHLKQINDTFGHSMGDHAIRTASEILRSALPQGTPLGRSGGDEFIALAAAGSEADPELIRARVKEACKAYNDLDETPFYEEISVGCHLFRMDKGVDIPSMFGLADKKLYEDKKLRRESVIRPRK